MKKPRVYIVVTGTYDQRVDTVFAELGDAKRYVLNVYGVTAVYQGAGVWAAHVNATDLVWIRRYPVRGGR